MSRARVVWLIGVASGLALQLASAQAGGSQTSEEEYQRAGFFGFVRDGDGNAVADARVIANFTTRKIKLIARSDVTGQFLITRLGNSNDPKIVEITCDKDGYRFDKAVPRNLVAKPDQPFEIDCFVVKK